MKGPPVTGYSAFSASEQQKAGVATRQTEPLLRRDLAAIVAVIRVQLEASTWPTESIALVGDMVLFTLAFRTAGRDVGLSHIMTNSVLRLSQDKGVILNFRLTKLLMEVSTHVCHVSPDRDIPDRCAVEALEIYAQTM